ncbi:MAG: hypothetical protein ACP6IU_13995 [Candidatus Asgardarchaeia archaeon]
MYVELVQIILLALLIASVILCAESKKLSHSLGFFTIFSIILGLLFFTLYAPLVAVFQLAIYAGTVSVLMIVIISLTKGGENE